MNQDNFRLGYPPIAQWIADDLPAPPTVRRTAYPRPSVDEAEQERRRVQDIRLTRSHFAKLWPDTSRKEFDPPSKFADEFLNKPSEPGCVTREQVRRATIDDALRELLATPKADPDGWIEWKLGDPHPEGDTRVDVKIQCNMWNGRFCRASDFNWKAGTYITHYRLTK